jgi:tetratricopeptide (TPR) repeat protein
VTVSALLAWGVATVMLAFQSETVVPPDQTSATPGAPSDAEFYLKRGEDFSSIQDYDRAIAEYTTAIRLNPDYAEAYNDRGFAYHYESGREGAACLVGFSSRQGAITIYGLHAAADAEKLLARLGKHKAGKGCVYINTLADVDMTVLAKLVASAAAQKKGRNA